MFFAGDKKEEMTKALLETHAPAMLKNFSEKCLGESKFLCGDTVTIHDMVCAGGILNSLANPNGRLGAEGHAVWEAAPENVKKYVEDFKVEMKEYLDKRPTEGITF